MASVGRVAANSALQGVIDTALTTGLAAAHSFAPDELEYYLCSLELYNADNERKGLLSFSVMPTDIMENRTAIATIVKTQYGVIETFTNGFVPRDISIRGTFGKRFRMVQAKKPPGKSMVNFFDNVGFVDKVFDQWLDFNMFGSEISVPTIHSGYGLTKLLKRMVEASFELDASGRPYILVFTNHALNTSYAVEVLQDSYSMNMDSNMIWQYSLEMKAIAPGTAVTTPKRGAFIAQQGINAAASAVGDLLKDVTKQAIKDIF